MLTPDVIGVQCRRRAARRRHVDRHGVARDRDAAQGQSSRKVRRIFRRGHRQADGSRPRDDCEHGARVRRDDRFFPGRRADAAPICARPAAPKHRSRRWKRTIARRRASALPHLGEIDYSQVLTLDLASITPNVAGPKRPQDRIALTNLKSSFAEALRKPAAEGGYGKAAAVPRPAAKAMPVKSRPLTATS